MWCEMWIKVHFLKIGISSSFRSDSLKGYPLFTVGFALSLSIYVWVSFGTLCSILVVCMAVFPPITYCHNYYRLIIVNLKIRQCCQPSSSSFSELFQLFCVLRITYKFQNWPVKFYQKKPIGIWIQIALNLQNNLRRTDI